MVGTTNAGTSSSILYVNITDSGSSYVADKTLAEIYKAYQEKKYVVVRHGEELLAPYSIEATEARFFFTSGNIYAEFTITNSGESDSISLTVLNLTASNIDYNNATSGMTADNLQTAVDELAASRSLQAVTDKGATTSNIVSFTNDTDSTSTTTGAVVITGGLGVAKAIRANQVYGAVWNDYAEFRRAGISFKPGNVVCEDSEGVLHVSCKRLQKNPHIVSDTYGLMGVLGEYKKPISYSLQLSLDGPEKVNDRNRGIGTTKRIKESLYRLFHEVDEHVPENVNLVFHFKPTLDMETIRELDSHEKIIDYYKFFEEFYDDFYSIEHKENVSMYPTKPNTACPMPHTSEDGKVFGALVRMCREVEERNKTEHFFKYFKSDITPYASNCSYALDGNGGTCGTCKYVIGLLPDKMISGCHSAFVNVLEKYKACVRPEGYDNKVLDDNMFIRDPHNFLYFSFDDLPKREQQMENYYSPGTTARLQASATMIQLLAYSRQVDPKYRDVKEATKAANYIGIACAGCINDNKAVTGTITLPQVGILRLLLNGADNYLIK